MKLEQEAKGSAGSWLEVFFSSRKRVQGRLLEKRKVRKGEMKEREPSKTGVKVTPKVRGMGQEGSGEGNTETA